MVAAAQVGVCLSLTQAISTTRTVEEIYEIALDTLANGLGVSRAAILLFDTKGVMRFSAWRRISDTYRAAVEGHSPWTPDSPAPQPLVVADVSREASLEAYLSIIKAEGIASMAFIPLVGLGRVIGKFMLYYERPHEFASEELRLAEVIAAQVAFAVERTRNEQQLRLSEARLQVALTAESARLEAVEEASRLKDEFLATLSHELRTPLNAILGWVEMLQAGDVPPERLRQAFEVIGRNTRLQAQLIDDILDVSRIITGKLEIERVPVALPQLIDTIVAGALPSATVKHVDLVKMVPENLPAIEGDPKRLHQVLGNVLSNAIKFTPDGGRVEIQCTIEGDHIAIDVKDSGVGIASEFLPYIFDRFSQADSRSTRKHGGLGLGLAITRHLVEQHGGSIRAHSDGGGCGTTMFIRLPIRRAGASAAVALMPTTVPPRDVDVRMDGSTVLVVDDQRDSRELLGAIFEGCGAHVVQCDGVTSALDVIGRSPVHLLVADIAMPDIDGYELIRRIRDSHNEVPAVAVSAYARPQDRRDALAAGYNSYCAKPIEAPQFLRTIREVLLAS